MGFEQIALKLLGRSGKENKTGFEQITPKPLGHLGQESKIGLEQIAFKILGRLGREDKMVLFLLIFLTLENKCDKYLKIALSVIFISGLEQGFLGR